MSGRVRAVAWLASGAAWALLSVGGIVWLWRYKSTPGIAAAAQAGWPERSRLARATDRPTLLMVAHPRCPCTRASMSELGELVRRAGGKVAARVLFVQPPGTAAEFVRGDLFRKAKAIPALDVTIDPDGQEAALFGAATSGQTYLFDPRGRLLFSGGLTDARGHEGEGRGRQRILALLDGVRPELTSSPLFGCKLGVTNDNE